MKREGKTNKNIVSAAASRHARRQVLKDTRQCDAAGRGGGELTPVPMMIEKALVPEKKTSDRGKKNNKAAGQATGSARQRGERSACERVWLIIGGRLSGRLRPCLRGEKKKQKVVPVRDVPFRMTLSAHSCLER